MLLLKLRLTLSLLVLWVHANDADYAVSFDNLALVADRLYASSYFHKSPPGNVTYIPDYGNSQ